VAGEEVYIARLGAWIARAIGEGGEFAADLDTEGMGLQLPDAVVNDPAVRAAATALADGGGALSSAAEDLDAALVSGDQGDLVRALLALVQGIYLFVDALAQLVSHVDAAAAALPSPDREATQGFGALLARRAIDALVITALAEQLPRVAYLFKLLGLIDWRVVEATGQPLEPRHVRKELHLERIKDLIRDPFNHLATVHKWGTANFDPSDLMDGALYFYRRETTIERGKVGNDAFLELGPFRWSRDSSVNPPGLRLNFNASTTLDISRRTPVDDVWGIDFTSKIALAGGVILRLKPPFEFSAAPKTGTIGGSIGFMVNRNAAARGFTIVGGNDLIQLTAEDFGIGAELTVGANTAGQVTIDPGVSAKVRGLTLSLGSEDADSFLGSLLADADIEGSFDIGLGWKLSQGLTVTAAGGLEIAIPMHQNLGIATFETLYIVLKIRNDGSFALETSAGITGQLGPLSATVERIGAEVTLAFSSGADAKFGPLDLGIRFKPPNGVGLALDAGVVKGGGYLYLDYEKGEYAGALELTFSGFLALKAIGLITTHMPDGSDGFSLLIIVTAEFGTPIQLGFGFTLIGVGGLLGLNRTMMLEELAEGVRTGAVQSIMFPKDVIANAPQIISDLRRFFPPKAATFLIGPMAKLGWGTPSLISASLGVIVEVPPGNVAILGVLKCVLPDEDAALLVLQVKFIGAIEVDKSRLWFFASLYGSRVLFITLDGDMGLLVSWGKDPEFIVSVGGFHPKFNPPPLPFPRPNRISCSILNESFARIRTESYFAVTSNTVQFGSSVELFFGVSDFSIEGHLGYDVLFQFSPFYFNAAFSASVSVKVFGAGLFSVRIRGELEGTSPWHVEGEGSISVLFFDIDIPFSHTWGESADTVLPSISALPIIKVEFDKRENWVALPPAGSRLSVSLRTVDATAELVLHPVGTLRISQRAVPLDLQIQKVGNQKVDDIVKAVLKVTAAGLARKQVIEEPFATAQFRDVDGAAKLSAPGYEKQAAGAEVSVSGGDTRTGHAVKRIVLHELIIIDNNYKEHIRRFFNVGVLWFGQLLGSNATARSVLSQANRTAKVPFGDAIVAGTPGFVVANASDNSAWGRTATFSSHAKAKDALAAEIKANPRMAADLHVIPAAELKAAA
jgi:hypothetical protein